MSPSFCCLAARNDTAQSLKSLAEKSAFSVIGWKRPVKRQSNCGVGFDPWIVKWNFETHHGVSPYIENGGGVLFLTRDIPLGEEKFNFTPTGAIGGNPLRGKYHWSIALPTQESTMP